MADWSRAFFASVLTVGPVPAVYAAQYLTIEQAETASFPSAKSFRDRSLTLTAEQEKEIEKASGVSVRAKSQRVYEALNGATRLGWFLVDEVYGKHEFITYSVALDPTGSVSRIEILDYRETYGGEIRDDKWRAQFYGKHHGAALKLDQDIANISGATLSCRHVTDGVKRLLAFYDVVLRTL